MSAAESEVSRWPDLATASIRTQSMRSTVAQRSSSAIEGVLASVGGRAAWGRERASGAPSSRLSSAAAGRGVQQSRALACIETECARVAADGTDLASLRDVTAGDSREHRRCCVALARRCGRRWRSLRGRRARPSERRRPGRTVAAPVADRAGGDRGERPRPPRRPRPPSSRPTRRRGSRRAPRSQLLHRRAQRARRGRGLRAARPGRTRRSRSSRPTRHLRRLGRRLDRLPRPAAATPVWQRTTIGGRRRSRSAADARSRDGDASSTEFADREYASVEDDVIYLDRAGDDAG